MVKPPSPDSGSLATATTDLHFFEYHGRKQTCPGPHGPVGDIDHTVHRIAEALQVPDVYHAHRPSGDWLPEPVSRICQGLELSLLSPVKKPHQKPLPPPFPFP